MVPGFEEQIIGMSKGEQKDFDLTFPKDFQDKEFANQKIHFDLTLEEVKEIVLPEIDGEFVAKFGRKNIGALQGGDQGKFNTGKKDREFQAQQAQIAEQLSK